jgi:general secretion pathway protein I
VTEPAVGRTRFFPARLHRPGGLRRRFRRNSRRRPGFSLIEVLVALAILGIALGAMMPRISLGTAVAERAERSEAAVLLAEQLLAEVGRTIPMPAPAVNGTTPDGYSWQITTCCLRTVNNTTGQSIAGLIEVRADVSWMSMRGTRRVGLVSRRLIAGASR